MDPLLSGHSIWQSLNHANPFFMTYNSPPILLFFFLLALRTYRHFYKSVRIEEKDDNLEEGLASYQDALPTDDKRQIIAEEEYYSREYEVKYYSDETVGKIKDALQADDDEIRS